MSINSDGGFYHGVNALAYEVGACPKCGVGSPIEIVPIAGCEVGRVANGEAIQHAVYCKCGTMYYARYDAYSGYVGIKVPDRSDVDLAWKELLDYVKN